MAGHCDSLPVKAKAIPGFFKDPKDSPSKETMDLISSSTVDLVMAALYSSKDLRSNSLRRPRCQLCGNIVSEGGISQNYVLKATYLQLPTFKGDLLISLFKVDIWAMRPFWRTIYSGSQT